MVPSRHQRTRVIGDIQELNEALIVASVGEYGGLVGPAIVCVVVFVEYAHSKKEVRPPEVAPLVAIIPHLSNQIAKISLERYAPPRECHQIKTLSSCHILSRVYNCNHLTIDTYKHKMGEIPKPTKPMKDINKKIKPLADRVLIKEDTDSKEKKTSSGIIIPVTVNEDKGARRGEVVAVGPGRHEDGKLVPTTVKPGDSVLFSWGDKIKVGEDEYHIVRESEILAVIK